MSAVEAWYRVAVERVRDLLANPADDHSRNVFDKAVRGKTDRFVMKFRKPTS